LIDDLPTYIGPYKVDRILGKGSYGMVVKAYDQRLSRWVAIKLLYDFNPGDLLEEARLIAELNHPNIVSVFDVFQPETESWTALIMEFLPDGTLADSIVHSTPVDEKTALGYCLDIAKGLVVAHDHSIIHGDLKAENLFFGLQKQLKIGDFGIARRQGEQIISGLGSYYSLSPEQASGELATKKSDLFALGLLLYRLLSGHHAFEQGDGVDAMLQRLQTDTPRYIETMSSDVYDFLTLLLAKLPEERCESADHAVSKLEDILFVHQSIDNPTRLLTKQVAINPIETEKPRRTNKFLFLGVGLVCILILSWGLWPAPPSYVLVLRPVVQSGESLPDLPLIKASIFQGMSESVSRQPSKRLIDNHDIALSSLGKKDVMALFQLTAVDELLFSELNCLPSQCAVTLSRWVKDDSVLLKRETIHIPIDDLLFVGDFIQDYLSRQYKFTDIEGLEKHTESSLEYRHLLVLGHEYENGERTLDEYINELTQYGCRYQYSCRELITAYKKMYHQQRTEIWLNKIVELIQSANFIYPPQFLRIEQITLAILMNNFAAADKMLLAMEGYFYTDDLVVGLRARWYFEQGFNLKGSTMMAQLVRQRPSARNRFNYALMLFKLSEFYQAVEVLEQLLDKVPEHQNAQELRADILFYLGSWALAIPAYEQLIARVEGDSPANLSNLGLAYMMQDKLPKAIEYFLNASQKASNNPQILLNLADAQHLLGQTETAQQSYKKVINLVSYLESKSIDDYLLLALANAQLKQIESSESALLQVIKANKSDPLLMFNVALVYLLLGDKTTCYVYLNKSVEFGIPLSWLASPWLTPLQDDKQFITLLAAAEMHRKAFTKN
jgi:serine/threonine-protein kinase